VKFAIQTIEKIKKENTIYFLKIFAFSGSYGTVAKYLFVIV